ncbi:putative peptidoglycan binding domain-containing protein, partial [Thermus scotoductus]
MLRSLGLYAGEVHGAFDEATERAFLALIDMENLDEREQGAPEAE